MTSSRFPLGRTLRSRRAHAGLLLAGLATGVLAAGACGGARGAPPGGPMDPVGGYDPDRSGMTGTAPGFESIYGAMGLIASGPPIGFVANAGTFATESPDTSIVVVALSIPNRGLSFRHESDGYRASYAVRVRLERDSTTVATARDSESVRITGFRETTRSDESIIYRRALRIPPGSYRMVLDVSDLLGGHEQQRDVTLVVRRFAAGTVTRPVPVYEATPRARLTADPTYLPRPRASAIFGVDDSVAVYLESYAAGPLTLALDDSTGRVMWSGSATLPTRSTAARLPLGSGVVRIPLDRAPMGVVAVTATRPGSTDTARTALYVGFGADLPVVSFDEMLNYLRYFALPSEVAALRRASPGERAVRWRAFLHATDPRPDTPQNEALDAYFQRIREANVAFRSDAPSGWRSDRGSVYVALGEPSNATDGYANMYDPSALSMTRYGDQVHLLVWEYAPLMSRLVFYEEAAGIWKLTPTSSQLFRSLLARTLAR